MKKEVTLLNSMVHEFFNTYNGRKQLQLLLRYSDFDHNISWSSSTRLFSVPDFTYGGNIFKFSPNWKEIGFSIKGLIEIVNKNLPLFVREKAFDILAYVENRELYLLNHPDFRFAFRSIFTVILCRRFNIGRYTFFFKRLDNEAGERIFIRKLDERKHVCRCDWDKLSMSDFNAIFRRKFHGFPILPNAMICSELSKLGIATLSAIELREKSVAFQIFETRKIYQIVRNDKGDCLIYDDMNEYKQLYDLPIEDPVLKSFSRIHSDISMNIYYNTYVLTSRGCRIEFTYDKANNKMDNLIFGKIDNGKSFAKGFYRIRLFLQSWPIDISKDDVPKDLFNSAK